LVTALQELGHGYVEGKTISIEYRFAEGKVERFADLATELVHGNVDLLVVGGNEAARAAKNATNTIPVIMVGVGIDPVEAGLVESYARPGGNITGFTNLGVETGGKRLELFKEAVPKIVRIAVPFDPNNRGNVQHVKEIETHCTFTGIDKRSLGKCGIETVLRLFSPP
jgi:ABC-type uncharacterized transport system substrate-binding protein